MIFRGFIIVSVIFGAIVVNSEDESEACKTEDGKEVKVGEQYDIPGQCGLNQCKGNDEWLKAPCRRLGVPVGWGSTREDPSKGYPACCAQPVPPLDLIPDILDSLPGTQVLEIIYCHNITAKNGNELTPTQVKAEPLVNFRRWAKPESHYLLIMTDPDAPSRQNPVGHESLHWMVGNIPGGNVKSGEVIVEYVGSGPPQGTGLHRYFLLLFKQPGKLTFDEEKVNKTSMGWRRNFSTRKFAEKYGLGSPEAINVYQAQYDDYVPQVHRQLGVSARPTTN